VALAGKGTIVGALPYLDDDRDDHGISDASVLSLGDDMCDAALASVPLPDGKPLGVLDRLKKSMWSALWAFHRRRRDGERLPPEYWFWPQ
jgi:hypothetical protein